MDDKDIDTDSFVKGMMSNKATEKCNSMLEKPENTSRLKLEDPALLEKGQSVGGNSNIVAHGNIVITSSSSEKSDATFGQRSVDECINFSESIELKKLVTQITELESLQENGQESWVIWKSLSDHCNVSNVSNDSATPPRYQLISSKEFYKAKCFLMEWYCRLIEQLNLRLKSDNEALQLPNERLFDLKHALEAERRIRQTITDKVLYILITALIALVLGLGWYGFL
ncbi:hypothetical protein HWQ46_03125 [Shewanella sp. D64]|uniref:hypothetical protein n=1 Tax=unclassified Shewanella TaxID=196818 RepID=UPI0022BA5481|nr:MULTISPECIES: hypothetical protein [unclassified Shewanella]MEC4724539.1 hypothetical protein [Shewanella sp. D64]MEC4736684.1 hypothetical protein [Shewanella sp. E94]WBJ94646.1 hypothetical protein HWQ47_22765 [Shewanella sp. MTB7]